MIALYAAFYLIITTSSSQVIALPFQSMVECEVSKHEIDIGVSKDHIANLNSVCIEGNKQ